MGPCKVVLDPSDLHLRKRSLIRPMMSFGLILEPFNCDDGLSFHVIVYTFIIYMFTIFFVCDHLYVNHYFCCNLLSLLYVMVRKYIKIKLPATPWKVTRMIINIRTINIYFC